MRLKAFALRILLIKIPHHAALRFAVRNSEVKYCVVLKVLLVTYKTEFTRYACSHSYPATFQNNFAYARCFESCAKAWQDLGLAKPLCYNVTLKQKAASQQRLGFFILKNPSNANVKREQSKHE
jgi:hypothetical protein